MRYSVTISETTLIYGYMLTMNVSTVDERKEPPAILSAVTSHS